MKAYMLYDWRKCEVLCLKQQGKEEGEGGGGGDMVEEGSAPWKEVREEPARKRRDVWHVPGAAGGG